MDKKRTDGRMGDTIRLTERGEPAEVVAAAESAEAALPAETGTDPDAAERPADARESLRAKTEAEKKRMEEALEAMKDGRGRLALETPLKGADREITELCYDFTELTGLEYTEAMDADPNASAQQLYGISYRQALALFAAAAAKQTPELDMKDIVSRIGVTDAVEGVQLASLFFGASTRAGRKRISKR